MKKWLQNNMYLISLIIVFHFLIGTCLAQSSISNGTDWLDTDGNIIQAHGGGFIKVGNEFFWFGTDKSTSSNAFTSIKCYSSTDLVHWEFRNAVVTNATHKNIGDYVGNRVIERPKVIFNESTGKYVMWAHWDWSHYGEAEAVVFQCDKIDGDYELVKHFRPYNNMARDCGLYKKKDGTAYFFAAANENADMVMYKLTDDYLDVKEQVATLWPSSHRESPVIFESGGSSYFITSGTTGWDPNQGKYSTSSSVEGSWSGLINFGNNTTFDSQPTFIFPVEGTEGMTFIYCGDRWKDPGLKDSKYIWLPIQFTPNGIKIDYMSKWSIDIEKGTWKEQKDSILSQEKWELVYVDSEDTSGSQNLATDAFDGNVNTFWHTEWKNDQPSHPHEIQIDLGDTASIDGLSYLPRQDNSANGNITKYAFYASLDKEFWNEPVLSGDFLPGSTEKIVQFDNTVLCRYIRLVALSEIIGSNLTSCAEINILGSYGNSVGTETGILNNELKNQKISVYPNPSLGSTLHLKGTNGFRYPLTLSIFDLYGRKIFNKVLSFGETTVHFHKKLASGTYCVVMKSEYGLLEKKLLLVI